MDYSFTCDNFEPSQILFCGQAFRFREEDGLYSGIVADKYLRLRKEQNKITIYDIDEGDIPFWNNYFDMDTDYKALIERFSADSHLREACREKSGIRILRQSPFETLISFIISQNNNIKRISGIIERLCEMYGEKKDFGYLFPTEDRLYGVTAEELAPLRAGFRAKYIADAMNKLQSGEIVLSDIYDMDYEAAKEQLKRIKGVGEKVADCVLLFGYYKTEAFPKDVWIKRVIAEFYPEGLPECIKGYEGIAQQYLFDYARRKIGDGNG